MTTTYICRHCGEPAAETPSVPPVWAHWSYVLDPSGRWSTYCHPNDPDSPTCEAVKVTAPSVWLVIANDYRENGGTFRIMEHARLRTFGTIAEAEDYAHQLYRRER